MPTLPHYDISDIFVMWLWLGMVKSTNSYCDLKKKSGSFDWYHVQRGCCGPRLVNWRNCPDLAEIWCLYSIASVRCNNKLWKLDPTEMLSGCKTSCLNINQKSSTNDICTSSHLLSCSDHSLQTHIPDIAILGKAHRIALELDITFNRILNTKNYKCTRSIIVTKIVIFL
jgi:hypothetical protein